MRILVVDDAQANCLLLTRILSTWGSCAVAANGRLAVDLFRAALDEGKPYDLIWLEIMMPVMDGLRALELIRHEERRRAVPNADRGRIVMTTTMDDVRNAIRAFNNQCDLYLTKPFSLDTICTEMEHLGFRREATPRDNGRRSHPTDSMASGNRSLRIGPEAFSDYTSFSVGLSRVIRRVR
jgi:two-component system, chemotaxis family, chemotaxis protein CheY